MNVLILTPDAVGSTLLQRLITIYMQFHNYDRPVINLHELTNGLVKYYNPTFKQELLGKKDGSWGYHQSLEQVVELLASTDHYKTSRLAHYHIKNRQDPIADQLPFYQYLNENFYIISCRRHNVFEHALSWCLSKITKKLNVYSGEEKLSSFFELYRDGLDIDPNSLLQTLNAYRDYLEWCNNHFNVANYFYYDEHLPKIEQYILNLPIFAQRAKRISWQENFGQDFDTWNRCHYLASDIGTLALDRPEEFKQLANNTNIASLSTNEQLFLDDYRKIADPTWPELSSMEQFDSLPEFIKQELETQYHLTVPTDPGAIVKHVQLPKELASLLPVEHQTFLATHNEQYQLTNSVIKNLTDTGVIVSAPPIKKQTLAEKKHMIKNYNHLLDVYNKWITNNPTVGNPINESVLDTMINMERQMWRPTDEVSADRLIDLKNTD